MDVQNLRSAGPVPGPVAPDLILTTTEQENTVTTILPTPECTCYPTPPEMWITYGGAVEPGSALQPNDLCRLHFPENGWQLAAPYGAIVPMDWEHARSETPIFVSTIVARQ